jgi:LDH2 family malate/lactate/ureidoglycolate dehydrogenase
MMIIKINDAEEVVHKVLLKWGFPKKDAEIMLGNMIDAELSGKKSHGFTNLFWYKKVVDGEYGPLNKSGVEPTISKETKVSLTIDGKEKTGYVVMKYGLELALKKVKETGLVSTALTNTAPTIGFIGSWAKMATNQGFIFICFSNAGSSTSPFGTTKKIVGTNPIAFGIPTGETPIILDMATAATTYANLQRSKALGLPIPENVGLNANGELVNDPNAILSGGSLIPFGGYKGSGISLMTEILAGALTGSKAGSNNVPYWGTFFLLIDPTLYSERDEFYKRVKTFRDEIKNSPKRPDVEEIFLPGEKSQNLYQKNLEKGEIDIDDNFFDRLKEISS